MYVEPNHCSLQSQANQYQGIPNHIIDKMLADVAQVKMLELESNQFRTI